MYGSQSILLHQLEFSVPEDGQIATDSQAYRRRQRRRRLYEPTKCGIN